MGRDYPDWGGRFNSQNQMLLYDLAELAARLGSPVTYERNGRVLFVDNFMEGLHLWRQDKTGNCSLDLINELVYSHGFAARLTCAPGLDTYIEMYRNEPRYETTVYGLSTFLLISAGAGGYFELGLRQWKYSVTPNVIGIVRVTWDGVVVIQSTDGEWFGVTEMSGYYGEFLVYGYIKLVLNVERGYYERLHLNEQSFDLSAYPLYLDTTPTAQNFNQVFMRGTMGAGVNNSYFIVDNFILTIDDPLNG